MNKQALVLLRQQRLAAMAQYKDLMRQRAELRERLETITADMNAAWGGVQVCDRLLALVDGEKEAPVEVSQEEVAEMLESGEAVAGGPLVDEDGPENED